MSNKKPHYRKSALVFEELEARLLLSADPLAVATDADTAAIEELVLDEGQDHTVIVQSSTEQSASSVRDELVIIDSRAPNYQQLHNDLVKAQQQGRNIHVVVLDAHRDGIEQINEVLATHDKLDAVHIVSHGTDGSLQLGATQLNKTSLRERSTDISQWRDSFSEAGDLLIYGCDLAETTEGKKLINALSYLTATDVAASDDLTGHRLMGGDWELEYEAGDIETPVAFSEDVQQNWQGTLNGAAPAAEEQEKAPAEDQQQAQVELTGQQAVINEKEQAATELEEQEQQAAITEEQRQEVVFIDESVNDFQSFLDDLQASSNGSTTFEIILLDSDRNGIDQINQTLSAYDEVDALHIISHGDDGAVKLGNTWLNTNNLDHYSYSLTAWGHSLDQDADILIYGCNLAETANGEQFVEELAQLTGADVAASDDITGHASLGGDWELEYKSGSVETSVALDTTAQGEYQGILNTFIVSNTNATGAGSLHQAILDANANTGITDTITFNIAGAGPHTINLTGALPAITDTVIIDGTTEPDFSYAGDGSPRPVVVIDGTAAGAVDGIVLGAGSDGSEISGLVIQNFQNDGILVQSDNNTITANILGLQADGVTMAGNNLAGTGIHGNIRIESANNIIGGLTPADRNIISGSGFSGIALFGAGATGNQIQGNFIGTDITGTLAKGNAQEGIEIQDASGNTIGGTVAGARNIISANGSDGMEIDNGDNNIIQGNYIGTDVTGTVALGNVRDGIDFNENVGDGSTGNLIGGADPNAANLIANNGIFGIEVRDAPTVNNTILGNSIYGNGQIGIQLSTDGVVTLNDAGDIDADSNNLQNFPVLTAATTNGTQIGIAGTLNSTANSYFRIEFFANTSGDVSGYGEGETYIGYANVATDGSGNATISAVLTANVANGAVISATATRSDATYTSFTDTSEFALNIIAASAEFIVSNTSDSGAGSLRQAIIDANATANSLIPDRISFDIGADGSQQTINLLSALDPISETVIIDGFSQYGVLSPSAPVIEINGAATTGADGLVLAAGSDGSTIQGLVINRFDGNGIEINSSNNNTVIGNFLGTDLTGTLDRGNGGDGILLTAGSSNQIGGLSANEGNLVAYNTLRGIETSGAGAGNQVLGNTVTQNVATGIFSFISGTEITGNVVYSNSTGFTFDEVVIGANQTLYHNTIHGSPGDGISVEGANAVIRNNIITGSAGYGIRIAGGSISDESYNLVTDAVTGQANLGGQANFAIDATDINADPLYVNAAVGNFMLIEPVNPAIDAGVDLGAGQPDMNDVAAGLYNGVAPDIGAFETTTTNNAPTATNDPGSYNTDLLALSPDGYWRLGESAGTTANDDGSTANSGTYNGVTLAQTGAISGDSNTAASFDGIDDYVEIPHDNSYLLDNGTVQFWFNTADVNQRADLFSKDALGNVTGGHLSIYLDGSGNIETRLQSASADYFVNSTSPLSNNQWHHVALTFGAGGMQLYLDGQFQDSDAYTGGLGATSGGIGNFEPIAIGASTQTSSTGFITPLQDYFTGRMDEVALFGTVLTADQIQDLYASAQQNYTIVEDTSLVVTAAEGVLINDSDLEGSPLTAVLVAGPSNAASFTLNVDGSFSYTPVANFSGTDTFTYMANDGGRNSNVATVTITVTGDNDAPVNTVPGTQAVLEDTQTAIVGISVADSDAGAGVITTQLTVTNGVLDVTLSGAASISAGANGSSTLTISGNVTDINASLASLQYTGNTNVNGIAADTLTVLTNDLGNTGTGGAQSDTDNIQINITAVNDVPLATANTVATTEDNPYSFAATDFTFSDVEGDGLVSATITNLSLAGGTLTHSGATLVNSGDTLTAAQLDTLIYTPAANANGTPLATFDFTVNDAGTGVITAQMSINVSASNDAPAARDDRIGLVFDGVDDYVTIGNYAGLNVTTNLTMEAWIKPTGLGAGSKIIVNKEGEYEMAINATTGEVMWAFDNVDPDWSWHYTGHFVQPNEWTHIAVTYDNGVVNTYANGVLVDTYNGSGAIGDNYPAFNQLQIGGRENAVTQRFDGQIDEVRIWNTTRSQLEVQTNMGSLLNGTEPGLIGNWRFDEGSGITVEDQSVFAHHGTLADGIIAAEMPSWQGYVVSEDGSLNVSALNGVLANDFDIDGDPLTAILVSGPSNAASFTLNPDGSFDYTPAANFNGVDSFTYRANDGSVDSNIATVTIRVDAVNDVPVATANTVATTEDNAYSFSAADFTFTDVEGDALVSATITNLALGGGTLTHSGGTAVNSGDTLTAAQLDTLIYTPAANANATPLATFDYTVNDAGAGVVAAQMSIDVTAVNDVPVATANTVTTTEDTAYSFSTADFTFSDVEGDSLVAARITNLNLAGGTLTHSGGTPVIDGNTLTAAQLDTLVYTPAANANATPLATFDFTVDDAGAGVVTAQMSIDVTAVNDVPVATANTVTTTEDNTYSFSAADFTFTDVEGDALVSATITNLALAGGTLTHSGGTMVNSGDTLTAAQLDTLVYTPPANTTGAPLASFDFSVNDAGSGVVAAQMSIDVNPVNDVPVATANTVTTNEDNAYSFSAADFTYSDTEGDALVSATITNLALAGGMLTHSGGTTVNSGDTLTAAQLDTLIYTPAANANGTPLATFDFTVNDAGAGVVSAQMSIDVTAQPDAAVIGGTDTGAVTEDVDPDMNNLLEVSGSLTIIDPDAGEASFNAGAIGGSYGVITLNANGDWAYAAINSQAPIQGLAAGATLTDTITISSVDGTTHDIVITIMGTNDAPVAGNDVANVNEGGSVIIDLAATDSDIDNALDLNSIVITNLPANGSVVVNGDGTVTYTHNGSETLSDGFNYTISDISGAVSNTATVTLSINPVNDPPVAGDDSATVVEAGSVLIDLAANDSDVDNALDLNSITIINAPVNGALVVNADGTVNYTHDGSETSGDSFSYSIADVSGAISNTATVNITVTPVNDAPTTSGIADVNVDEDAASTSIDLNAAFDDSDNLDSELSYAIVGNNNIGLFSVAGVDNTTGRLTLDYATDMNGLAQISVRATDPSGSFVDTLFSVTVNAVNDNPVLQTNTGMQATEAATISRAELNVTDVDNLDTELVYTVTSLPANGELRLNGMVMALNGTFTQADLDNNLLLYVPTGAVTADQFGFTVSDSAGGAIGNNTFNILLQFNQDNDDEPAGEPPPNDSEEEETTEEETGETETGGLTDGAGGYGGGYEPFGGSSAPPTPTLTIDPQPEPVPEKEKMQPVEEEHEATEIEQHEIATFAAVQVKSIDALWSAIDKMKQEMAESEEGITTPVEFQVAAAKSTGVVLTAGVVAWILRSGALLSSLMSTIPLWKGYDPLPILAYKDDDEDNKDEAIDEHKIPTSLDDLRKLKKLMQQKQKSASEVDVDSMFGGSTIRDQ